MEAKRKRNRGSSSANKVFLDRVFGIQKLMKIAKSKGASKVTFLTQVKESVNTRAV
jgi:hypothetical protein